MSSPIIHWPCLVLVISLISIATEAKWNNPHQASGSSNLITTSGCGIAHAFIGESKDFDFHTEKGGGSRKYTLHLPKKYDSRIPMPLIMSFHGYTDTAHIQERFSKVSNETLNPDKITVYPQGLRNAWQGAPYAGDQSDLDFTTDLLQHLETRYCIDKSRIYANGFSNGGTIVNLLACGPSGAAFAAFSPVAGAFYGDDGHGSFPCHPSRPSIPMLEIHGEHDNVIPYYGGSSSGVPIPAIEAWLENWGLREDCHPRPQKEVSDILAGRVKKTTYKCPGKKETVEGLMIRGHAHRWPNIDRGAAFEGATYVLDFFNQHQKSVEWMTQ